MDAISYKFVNPFEVAGGANNQGVEPWLETSEYERNGWSNAPDSFEYAIDGAFSTGFGKSMMSGVGPAPPVLAAMDGAAHARMAHKLAAIEENMGGLGVSGVQAFTGPPHAHVASVAPPSRPKRVMQARVEVAELPGMWLGDLPDEPLRGDAADHLEAVPGWETAVFQVGEMLPSGVARARRVAGRKADDYVADNGTKRVSRTDVNAMSASERRERRLEANRLSATVCRARKRFYAACLEESVAALERENIALRAMLAQNGVNMPTR